LKFLCTTFTLQTSIKPLLLGGLNPLVQVTGGKLFRPLSQIRTRIRPLQWKAREEEKGANHKDTKILRGLAMQSTENYSCAVMKDETVHQLSRLANYRMLSCFSSKPLQYPLSPDFQSNLSKGIPKKSLSAPVL
jgi:hypothetical protein